MSAETNTANGSPQAQNHENSCESPRARRRTERPDAKKADDMIFPSENASRQSQKTVTPFLTHHIPLAMSQPEGPLAPKTEYCYRHRPDHLCRRQADEPSMEQLQSELGSLSQSDQQAIAHVWSLFSAAPAKHRKLMLGGVLAQCCGPQLSFLASSVPHLIKIDPFAVLPTELCLQTLRHLDTASLCKAAQVSRRWRSFADDDSVWHRMCEQHIDRKCTQCGWGLPLMEKLRLRKEKTLSQARAGECRLSQDALPSSGKAFDFPFTRGTKRPADDPPAAVTSAKRICQAATPGSDLGGASVELPSRRPWKDVYRDRFRIGTNWKHGRYSTKTWQCHAQGITCLQFDDQKLVTGSWDCTVKIWDMATGKKIRTLLDNVSPIRCLQYNDTQLITGARNGVIQIWDWRTGELLKTWQHHPPLTDNGVISLHWTDQILVLGCQMGFIGTYGANQQSTNHDWAAHADWVNSLKVDVASRTLFSASDDCFIKLWDLDSRVCIKTYTGHSAQVQQIILIPPEVEIDEEDYGRQVPSHNSNVGSPFESPTSDSPEATHTGSLLFPDEPDRPAPPSYMLTASLDGTVRLWHVASGRCIHCFFGHVEGVWSIAVDSLRVVSGAQDKTVKVWDLRTGKYERTLTGHTDAVTCVGLTETRIVSGSEDGSVRVLCFEGATREACQDSS